MLPPSIGFRRSEYNLAVVAFFPTSPVPPSKWQRLPSKPKVSGLFTDNAHRVAPINQWLMESTRFSRQDFQILPVQLDFRVISKVSLENMPPEFNL